MRSSSARLFLALSGLLCLASISAQQTQPGGNLRSFRTSSTTIRQMTSEISASGEAEEASSEIIDGSQYSQRLADTRRGDPNVALPTQADPPRRVAEDRSIVDRITGMYVCVHVVR